MEWYTGSDLRVNQQQILTPPPRASSTSPVFSAETLRVLIPAGLVSSESPHGRKTVKQKEETDTFSAVLFCCRRLKDSRSSRSQSGHFLRDGKPQLPAHGAAAGCGLHSPLCTFIAAAGAAAAQRHGCCGPGTLLPREMLRRAVCASTSLCPSYEELHNTRSTREQSLSIRDMWLSVHGSGMVLPQHVLWEKKAAIRKLPQSCLL